MRLIQNDSGWRPLISAPLDEDLTLLVIDGPSEPYQLKLPSRLTAAGWVSSSRGTPLAVTPVKWRPYYPPRPFQKKGWRAKLDGVAGPVQGDGQSSQPRSLLPGKNVSNLPAAVENAKAFVAEIIERLRAADLKQEVA